MITEVLTHRDVADAQRARNPGFRASPAIKTAVRLGLAMPFGTTGFPTRRPHITLGIAASLRS
jgi:hypothetical protein